MNLEIGNRHCTNCNFVVQFVLIDMELYKLVMKYNVIISSVFMLSACLALFKSLSDSFFTQKKNFAMRRNKFNEDIEIIVPLKNLFTQIIISQFCFNCSTIFY